MCFIAHQSKRRYDEDQNKQGNGKIIKKLTWL